MQLSTTGLELLKRSEGFRSHMYNDVNGFPTIGYGHRLRPAEAFPYGISEAQATGMLAADVRDDLAQRAAVDAGIGRGRLDCIARLRVRRAESRHCLFRHSRIEPDLGREIADIDVAAELAQNSVENAHSSSDRNGVLFEAPRKPASCCLQSPRREHSS